MITNLGIIGVARKVYLIVFINISKILLKISTVCIYVSRFDDKSDLLQFDRNVKINSRQLLSRFFDKNIVKPMFLLKKLLKSQSHKMFFQR